MTPPPASRCFRFFLLLPPPSAVGVFLFFFRRAPPSEKKKAKLQQVFSFSTPKRSLVLPPRSSLYPSQFSPARGWSDELHAGPRPGGRCPGRRHETSPVFFLCSFGEKKERNSAGREFLEVVAGRHTEVRISINARLESRLVDADDRQVGMEACSRGAQGRNERRRRFFFGRRRRRGSERASRFGQLSF